MCTVTTLNKKDVVAVSNQKESTQKLVKYLPLLKLKLINESEAQYLSKRRRRRCDCELLLKAVSRKATESQHLISYTAQQTDMKAIKYMNCREKAYESVKYSLEKTLQMRFQDSEEFLLLITIPCSQ